MLWPRGWDRASARRAPPRQGWPLTLAPDCNTTFHCNPGQNTVNRWPGLVVSPPRSETSLGSSGFRACIWLRVAYRGATIARNCRIWRRMCGHWMGFKSFSNWREEHSGWIPLLPTVLAIAIDNNLHSFQSALPTCLQQPSQRRHRFCTTAQLLVVASWEEAQHGQPATKLQSPNSTLTAAPCSGTLQRRQQPSSKTQPCNSSYTWSNNPSSFAIWGKTH